MHPATPCRGPSGTHHGAQPKARGTTVARDAESRRRRAWRPPVLHDSRSFAAIGYGKPQQQAPFDETNWTDSDSSGATAYVKSKTLGERAAWDFIASEGGRLELSVVNPVGVFGPVLGPDFSASIMLVKRMLDGAMPGVPLLYFGVVDVRDVVDLHLRAMIHPAAKGERFLAVAGEFMSMLDVARILKRRMGESASRVPTRQLPNWLVQLGALRDPALRQILPELGKTKNASTEKARHLLGWPPRSNEEAIVATAESLQRLGLLQDNPKSAKDFGGGASAAMR